MLTTRLLEHEREDVRAVQWMLKQLGYRARVDFDRADADDSIREPSLGLFEVDGRFGPVTESVVEQFQEDEGILVDGVVGTVTMQALEEAWARHGYSRDTPAAEGFLFDETALQHLEGAEHMRTLYRLTRVPTNTARRGERMTVAERAAVGFHHVTLRSDVAAAFAQIRDAVNAHHGLMTCAAGIRSLAAGTSPTRSATSMHYVGRAFDLDPYSGMVDPGTDPFVVTCAGEAEGWRVHARVTALKDLGETTELTQVVTYRDRSRTLRTRGKFLDLTALMARHGFRPIGPRRTFFRGGNHLAADWWHFQHEAGLVPGVSTFGGELRRLYPEAMLEGTPPWKYRDLIYGLSWT